MCRSTGVCGVEVDPVLAQFAADLHWVAEQGVTVSRHNLGQEPAAFAANAAVVKEMEAGMERLPVILIDGHRPLPCARATRAEARAVARRRRAASADLCAKMATRPSPPADMPPSPCAS